ncbi:hypothetical protein QQS21_001201 [Conoideocrella luteorostrata]|uniref:Uncharacterized protein n=1 Tax=Conoideocrella luteorostrata TaxID=1105319 RepID=A0AAJ0G210_9HYPO|nr:hypothetical protein QQS21_001201 [Conoideocrella luteorostrata]
MYFATLLVITAAVHSAHASLIWAANFAKARDSKEAGFGNVQIQDGSGPIRNNGPAIPVINHPKLGKSLNISLNRDQMRWEAAPGGSNELGEGRTTYFRVDFVLGDNFNIGQDNPFCLLNQIHQASNSGSPPIEFDVHDNALWVRGASTAYNKKLIPVAHDTVYKLVYGVTTSSSASKSRLNVWVNENQVLRDFAPKNAFRVGGDSYWKGATMYCSVDVDRPLEVYQNAHRVGDSYNDVA